ncbi:MAG: class I SAM-dependent methyltransferase [Oligoflexia bacterium]|nr:class I SAM-dependent methyltransferase [Oligoflexia bacterium]
MKFIEDNIQQVDKLFLYCTAFVFKKIHELITKIASPNSNHHFDLNLLIQKGHIQSHPLLTFMESYLNEYSSNLEIQHVVSTIGEKQIFRKIEEIDKHTSEVMLLVNDVLAQFACFYDGRKKGKDIIFSLSGAKRWKILFRDSLLAKMNSHLVLSLIDSSLDLSQKQKWLELGAGVGGTTFDLINYSYKKKCLETYYYSDIHETFWNLFIRDLKNNYNFPCENIKFLKLNIDDIPCCKQFDTIFATNVIHCASNIISCLNIIKEKLLVTNGSMVIAETIRTAKYKNIFLEIIYHYVEDYSSLPIHVNTKERGLYNHSEWLNIINQTNFKLINNIQLNSCNAVYLLK